MTAHKTAFAAPASTQSSDSSQWMGLCITIWEALQLPIDRWYEIIGNPTMADAILDRLVHNAYRIELKGESLRKQKQSAPDQSVT